MNLVKRSNEMKDFFNKVVDIDYDEITEEDLNDEWDFW